MAACRAWFLPACVAGRCNPGSDFFGPFVGLVSVDRLLILGFLAMLHPAELVALTRRDLVFPEDTLGHTRSLFVHLRNPKASRFARRQHGRIDDPAAIRFIYSVACI